MNQNRIAERLEHFVRTQFRVAARDKQFDRSQPLFELGYVDSVGVLELLSFLGEEFEVEIPDAMLVSEEFSTIDGIATIVWRLRNGGTKA